MASSASFDWFDGRNVRFEPAESHHFVEISMTPPGIVVHEEYIQDAEFHTICARKDSRAVWRLLLLETKQTSHNVHPYSETTAQLLKQHWHMGETGFISPTWSSSAAFFCPSPSDPSIKGLRFKQHHLSGMTLTTTHVPQTRTTYALLSSLPSHTPSQILSALLSCRNLAHKAHLLPFIYVSCQLTVLDDLVRMKPTTDYCAITDSLGATGYFAPPDDHYEAPDITHMPRTLMALQYLIATSEDARREISVQIACVVVIADLDGYDGELKERLKLVELKCERLGAWLGTMKEVVGAMVQLVYATLQQRDNELNHRYAADMRVITAITLVFLPGTFVATLFSASFWNFDPRSHGPMVSRWVWLYFFVTFALTLIVLGVWRGYTVLKQVIRGAKRVWRASMPKRETKAEDEEAGKKGD